MTPNDRANNYLIVLHGHFDLYLLRQFEDLEITHLPNGETIILGMMDQSALHGVLKRIGDLGLEIISIQRVMN